MMKIIHENGFWYLIAGQDKHGPYNTSDQVLRACQAYIELMKTGFI
jgi:hypothetical protein